MVKRLALALAAVLAVSACSAQSVSTAVPAASPNQGAPTMGAPTQVAPVITLPPLITPEPTPTGPAAYKPGDTVTLQQNGADWATITISNVSTASSYKGTYSNDTPQTAGDVFIAAKVTYAALTDGVTYNPYDWSVFCGGTAVSTITFVLNGPKPELNSGTLPNGKNASGYVVYEVAATGEVDMYYGGAFGGTPVFEVIIRAS
jgi:glucose/arabinose dehydrogenase